MEYGSLEVMTIYHAERLSGVHPNLARIVRKASISLFERTKGRYLTVIEGVRTPEQQQARYDQGRTKPGKIVTNSLKSKHLRQKDGFGYAVDIALCDMKGKIDWEDLASFELVRQEMLNAAKELGISNLRSGADWDRDNITDYKEVAPYIKEFGHRPLVDYPHYELL